jgi:predicted nucleic acid-binding protein
MKRYWDASALIDALHDSRVEQKALEADQWTRAHALAETFATLTGGKLGFRYLPDDAAALIRELAQAMNFVELDAAETLAAMDIAQQLGVRGGRVHDWLHARAAQKAKVTELLTDNLSDFAGLERGFSVVAP